MNRIFKLFALTSVLVMGLNACSVEGPDDVAAQNKIPQMSEDVVSGELLVRFDSRVSDILEKAGVTKSGINAPATRSGVLSVDQILSLELALKEGKVKEGCSRLILAQRKRHGRPDYTFGM